MKDARRILFVCLGNICRSPLAEGVFQHLVDVAGLGDVYEIDSAGTSAYHAGDRSDERSIAVALKHGIRVTSRSRKVRASDFETFDLILAMDQANLRDLLGICPSEHAGKVRRMRDYDPAGSGDVDDPYYGGPRGFDDNFEMLMRTCEALLEDTQSA